MNLCSQRHSLRTVLFLILTLLLVPFTFAVASYGGGFSADGSKSGFSGPGTPTGISTVVEALKMADDSRLILKGSITKQTGNEKYEFKDATGTIILDIDDDVWWGQSITPADVVIIKGEMDHELDAWQNTREIDVDSVIKQ